MGSAQSSPSDHHVFRGGHGQLGFGLIESLQQNPESDATRERTLHLTIQKKVTEELQKLHDKETSTPGVTDENTTTEPSQAHDLDRNSVAHSITALSQKLSAQPKSFDEEESVKKAEVSVVRCLRLNDRRPLDCWKEVDDFKREVARLETRFVNKIVGDI
ncbi:hypothetical protein TWF696_006596 [Orbilia brochopaga]|uniref:DUF1690-domain-containing protein n=1 Tax=Orbilia brochopaga TaxID=3140254 RepID=A0AAV9UXM4_9PEZI